MTLRLTSTALDRWADLDGWAASLNLPDLRDLPLERFCNLVWYWLTKDAEDPNEVDKFKTKLWQPPKGEVGQGPWSAEAETAAFVALKRQVTK